MFKPTIVDASWNFQASHDAPPQVHRLAIHALLAADLAFTSRLYRAADFPVVRTGLLGVCAALVLFYTMYAFMRGFFGRASIVVLGSGLIATQLYHFSAISGFGFEVNAGFSFVWILSFIVFFTVCRDGYRQYLAETLFRYATAYTIFYVVLCVVQKAGIFPGQLLAGLVSDDPERGERLFLYGTASAFAWFGWLYRARKKVSAKNGVMLIICAMAFVLAESRVLTLLLGLLTVGFLLSISNSVLRFTGLLLLWASAAASLYGLLDPDWNPYVLLTSDSSGAFRMHEYELARELIGRYPFFGVGLASSQSNAWSFFNYDYFAASDLGVMGVWLDWGFTGFVLFMIASHLACTVNHTVSVALRTPLLLTGCLMAAYGCIAPVVFYPGGTTYFAVLFGYWLDSYDRSPKLAAIGTPVG